MTRRTAIALALVVAALAPAPAARAQSKSDAFAGRIPPISGQLYRKAGRVELTPSLEMSLNDAFFTKYFGGLKIGYHFTESISAAVHAAGGAAVSTSSAVLCSKSTGCSSADERDLQQVPGRIRAIGGLELAWAPVYGKLNVLAEKVAHFDLSVFAGPDVIAHDEILSTAAASVAGGASPKVTTTFGGHVGLGARLFLTEWIAARLEVKDYVYAVKVPNAGPGNDVQNQIFAELGFSFFLPARNLPLR